MSVLLQYAAEGSPELNIVISLSVLVVLFVSLFSLGKNCCLRTFYVQLTTKPDTNKVCIITLHPHLHQTWFGFCPARVSVCIHPTPLQAAEWRDEECARKSNSRNKSCSLLSGLRAEVTASVNKGQRSLAGLEAVKANAWKTRMHTYRYTHTNSPHSLHNARPKWQGRYGG